MAPKRDDLAKLLEQAEAERREKRTKKRNADGAGRRKQPASTTKEPVIDLEASPVPEVVPEQVTATAAEPPRKKLKIFTQGGRVKETVGPHSKNPEGPPRSSQGADEEDDLPSDDLPIAQIARGSRRSSSASPVPRPSSVPTGAPIAGDSSSRSLKLPIELKESFRYSATARSYLDAMFTDEDLTRLSRMRERKLDFGMALAQNELEGLLLIRGLRDAFNSLSDEHRGLKRKLQEEVKAREGLEKRESEAFYNNEKIKEAAEKLRGVLKRKEEQFDQAQNRIVQLSNDLSTAENKCQAAALEQARSEKAHAEEMGKLKEKLEASVQENVKLGRALENLEASKAKEIEVATAQAVVEYQSSQAFKALLVQEAYPAYELGQKRYRQAILEHFPELELAEVDDAFGFDDDEADEDAEASIEETAPSPKLGTSDLVADRPATSAAPAEEETPAPPPKAS